MMLVNVLSLILPLIITSFCVCRILSCKSEGKHSMVRLLLALLAVYLFFWTPYNIVTFLQFLQRKGHLLSCELHTDLNLAKQCVEAIALSHCCLNPIIYACAGQKFRRAVLTVLKEQLPSCFSQHITCSPPSPESVSDRPRSGPYTAWNDGTWKVHSCLQNLGHKQAIGRPHVSHENK